MLPEELFESLQHDLGNCQRRNDTRKCIECSYQASFRAWRELKEFSLSHVFGSLQEEIDFFKKLKPPITAELLYQLMLYEADHFKPEERTEQHEFWQREEKKIVQFMQNNRAFIAYMHQNETCRDAEYFTRIPAGADSDTPFVSAEKQPWQFSSKMDGILAKWIATARYATFVSNQVQKLYS